MGAFVISPLPPLLLESLQTAGPLRSADITPLPRYYGPLRHPLVFHRFPRVSGYTASRSADFATGRGGFLQLLNMPLSPCCPYYPAGVSRRCLRPEAGGSVSRSIVFRGHLWVYLRCGPVTRSPSRGWLCQSASSVSFPPRMRPKLRGPDYYPGETYVPLNMSAFLGHTASSQSKTDQEQCILKSSLASGPNLCVALNGPTRGAPS